MSSIRAVHKLSTMAAFIEEVWWKALTALTVVLCICHTIHAADTGDTNVGKCVFAKHQSHHSAMDTIAPLVGKRFTTKDDRGYEYNIGICETASDINNMPPGDKYKEAAALQQDTTQPESSPKVLGKFSDAEIMAGSNWVSLEYESGEGYGTHCGNEGRRTLIMITCKSDASSGELVMLEEQKNKTGDCYYLFELEHSAVCPIKSGGLSVGSIIVIIFLLLASLYVIAGFIYQRFIAGAKGMEQIPNYSFWKDFGNLTADGCDLVCRSGSRDSAQRQYRGIGDEQLDTHDEDQEDIRDEHLLPM